MKYCIFIENAVTFTYSQTEWSIMATENKGWCPTGISIVKKSHNWKWFYNFLYDLKARTQWGRMSKTEKKVMVLTVFPKYFTFFIICFKCWQQKVSQLIRPFIFFFSVLDIFLSKFSAGGAKKKIKKLRKQLGYMKYILIWTVES